MPKLEWSGGTDSLTLYEILNRYLASKGARRALPKLLRLYIKVPLNCNRSVHVLSGASSVKDMGSMSHRA